jgi:hypothetical protein
MAILSYEIQNLTISATMIECCSRNRKILDRLIVNLDYDLILRQFPIAVSTIKLKNLSANNRIRWYYCSRCLLAS